MKSKPRSVLIIAVLICSVSVTAYAKTFAWLTDYTNKAYKLDVAAMQVVQNISITKSLLPSATVQNVDTVADNATNSLFVIYDYPGRATGQGVRVFNLKDLSFKKDLGISSQNPNFEFPKIIIPPIGNKFYLAWWDRSKEINQAGGESYGVYDKNTLNKLSDMASFPFDLNQPRMFSADGTKLYVTNTDANQIQIYDSSTLSSLETVSISNIWDSPLYAKRVLNTKGNLNSGNYILFEENIKSGKSDPNNYKYLVYNTQSRSIANKMGLLR